MSLTTPEGIQKLQTALHAKAKGSPDVRFYTLYDKVHRKDLLTFAYACCKANGGAARVDRQRFEDIEVYGEERWLDELAQELKNRTYQPLPVRRVYIPKADGKSQRPLGIPAIRDRAAQMAAVLVLEPIFEADLPPEQYAYRKDRSALDAVRHVHKLIKTGHREIVDADLSSYFDEIPHAELLKSVARRVVDGAMLHLIKMWLEAPVEETDDRGNKRQSTRNRDKGRGTPQGSPISPMLSNIYMRRFVLGWKRLGHESLAEMQATCASGHFAWRTALWARLKDGELAHHQIQELLRDWNTVANLFGYHPPVQLDGNFGVTAGFAEMLLQSQTGIIELLPALPREWPTGSVAGLRARGGYTVDMKWRGGQLSSTTERGEKGSRVCLRYGQETIKTTIPPSGYVLLGADMQRQTGRLTPSRSDIF